MLSAPQSQDLLQERPQDFTQDQPQEQPQEQSPRVPDFDAMFANDADPWHFRTRWYEIRKRALTLACLPQPRYASAFEPGCANGELTAALADRCDALLATDGSQRAVQAAQARLAELAHVQVRQAWLPQDWPVDSAGEAARFDLIVLSEVAYYLQPDALAALVTTVHAALLPGGTVLACHWRRPIAGCAMDGDAVHAALHALLPLPHLLEVVDADLRLDVWQDNPLSVAQQEGLA